MQGELVQEEPFTAAKLQMVSKGKVLPLDQAIHLSIDCACKLLSLATSLYSESELGVDQHLLHKSFLFKKCFPNPTRDSKVVLTTMFSILASLDVKKKLYGSVLVVGGGLSFPGAPLMLQQRLYSKLPPMFQRSSDAIEVCSNPKVYYIISGKQHTLIFQENSINW